MVLVDSNVLLDVLDRDPVWFAWSAQQMDELTRTETLAINPLIYAEVSTGYTRPDILDRALAGFFIDRLDLPYTAAFLAGKAFKACRQQKGTKRSPMPEFYIGAHAQVLSLRLLTRDVSKYRTYFPNVQLITPPSA